MSLVVLVKNDTEGFAFSDGALSTLEAGIVATDFSKIVAVRRDLVIAAAGGPEAMVVLGKAAALPCNITFSSVVSFLRALVAEHDRTRRPKQNEGDISGNLGVAVLGHEAGKGIRLVTWECHTGKEVEEAAGTLAWAGAINDDAWSIGVTHALAAFRWYEKSNDQTAFTALIENLFTHISQTFPKRIGGQFFWARVGANVDGIIESSKTAQAGADVTASHTAAGFAGQGALATKNTASLDSDVTDGATYGRPKLTALTAGQIDPSKSGVLCKGVIPPIVSEGFIYKSTSSSITWYWDGTQGSTTIKIRRADGTNTTLSGSQAVTGLNPNFTYYFFPYYDEAAGILKWVAGDEGSPAIACSAWTLDLVQSQGLQGYVPLSEGGMSAATTVSGGGGGNGGGRKGSF